jgi:hypothetical protein
LGSFLGCYIYFSQLYGNRFSVLYNDTFMSTTYFHLAVESCILAILESSLYPEGNCDQQGVILTTFNPWPDLLNLYNPSTRGTTKLQGPGTDGILAFQGIYGLVPPAKNRYPWLCSLRTTGFKSPHRCGVTLLSAPPKPTIFASAAHCNYVCKDEENQVVDMCCCRESERGDSCRYSSVCGTSNNLQLASPRDLEILCLVYGQLNLDATRIKIREVRNHPNYIPLSRDNPFTGPMGGHDISVYIVDDSHLANKLDPFYLWPACLPKSEDEYLDGNRGILAGWREELLNGDFKVTSAQDYINQVAIAREALFELQPCKDPSWMKSNTYYPPGTACYTEAAWAGAVKFGMSGSGLVRPFYSNNNKVSYSWIGPLSLSKGTDRYVSSASHYSDYSSNPAVFTDARCYMDWIAKQYGLSLPAGYSMPPYCALATGDKLAANNSNCLSRALYINEDFETPKRCNFTSDENKCTLAERSGESQLTVCFNILNQLAICANDCPGVDPNAVVVGGVAALLPLASATSFSVNSLLEPALGAVVGVAGLGMGQMMGRRNNRTQAPNLTCPPGQCWNQGRSRCCELVVLSGRNLCPLFC